MGIRQLDISSELQDKSCNAGILCQVAIENLTFMPTYVLTVVEIEKEMKSSMIKL